MRVPWVLVAVLVAGCASPPSPSGRALVTDGFEAGLTVWGAGHAVPGDAGNASGWLVSRSYERAVEGNASARFEVDGSHGTATLWLQRPVPAAPDEARDVRLSLQASSDAAGADIVLYAGFDPPGNATAFIADAPDHAAGRHALAAGSNWQPEAFTWAMPTHGNATVWVALGLTTTEAARVVVFMDDVRIELQPA